MLMAHLDVVPANDSNWDAPPFDAEIKDGFIYARGTIDFKQGVMVRPSFFYFLFYRFFFSQQVRVGGRNKNKNKIHSDHFPIELKSKETQLCQLCFLQF